MKTSYLFLLMMMSMMISHAQQSQIIAHRGAWKNTKSPQNSIAALKDAVEQKCWGSEFDVHITKDDILVVNHDHDFLGIDIATSTYQELLAKKHVNGESIPTVEEYLLEGLKQKGTKLIFELKSSKAGLDRTLKAAELSMALVHRLKAQKQVEFIAFSYEACLKLKALDKKIKVHYLSGDKSPTAIKEAQLDGIDYNIAVFKKNPTWLQEAKTLKLKTNVWTVNLPEDMQFFINEKVDYITTDEPEKLLELMKK